MNTLSSLLVHNDTRGVYTLTLNRPEKHNALNDELIQMLYTRLQSLQYDPAVRTIVLTGAGNTFCSGGDLDWFKRMTDPIRDTNFEPAQRLAGLLRLLHHYPKPTVARIQGPAYGGGVGLIACCDIAIAADSARFALTELRLGLIPAVISPYILDAIGARQSRRLFLTGAAIDGTEAQRLGLVHKLASGTELDNMVEAEIARLLKSAPNAVTQVKRLLVHLTEASHGNIDTAAELSHWLRDSAEATEGLNAFFEKRNPKWQGE